MLSSADCVALGVPAEGYGLATMVDSDLIM
jgi:hypothetical protein